MNTTLENLTEKVRENNLKNLAKNIVKYQDFQTSIILNRIDSAGLSKATLKNYIDYGISYLKTGKINRNANAVIKYLDECVKECVQPLVPKQEEKRQNRKATNKPTINVYQKNTTLPVQNVLSSLVSKNIHKSLAVKLNDSIIIQQSEEEANGFIKGIKFMDKNLECKLINISYEAI